MNDKPWLNNRVIIMNGYTDAEIVSIMRVVKSLYGNVTPEQAFESIVAARQLPAVKETDAGDLIFAKTTANSLEMKISDVIEDMSGDHEYLRKNPPGAAARAEATAAEQKQKAGDEEPS